MGKLSLLGGLVLAQPVLGAETLGFTTKHSATVQVAATAGGSTNVATDVDVIVLLGAACKNIPALNTEMFAHIENRITALQSLAEITDTTTAHVRIGKITPVSCEKGGNDIKGTAVTANHLNLKFDMTWYVECFAATDTLCATQSTAILAKLNAAAGNTAFIAGTALAELATKVSEKALKPKSIIMAETGNTAVSVAGSKVGIPFAKLTIARFSNNACTTAVTSATVTQMSGSAATLTNAAATAFAGSAVTDKFSVASFRAGATAGPRATPAVSVAWDATSNLGVGATLKKYLIGACIMDSPTVWTKVSQAYGKCATNKGAAGNLNKLGWMTFKSTITACYVITSTSAATAVASTPFKTAALTAIKTVATAQLAVAASTLTAAKIDATPAIVHAETTAAVVHGSADGGCAVSNAKQVKHTAVIYWAAKNGSTGLASANQDTIVTTLLTKADKTDALLAALETDSAANAATAAANGFKVDTTVEWGAAADTTSLLLPEYTVTTYTNNLCTLGAGTPFKIHNYWVNAAATPTTCPAADAKMDTSVTQQYYTNGALSADAVNINKATCTAGVLTFASPTVVAVRVGVCENAPLSPNYMKMTVAATTSANVVCADPYPAAAASNAYVAAASLWALALAFVSMA